jgi:hypothetical protein
MKGWILICISPGYSVRIIFAVIVSATIAQTTGIDGTANIWGASIVLTGEIANNVSNALNVVFFWVAGNPFVRMGGASQFQHRIHSLPASY